MVGLSWAAAMKWLWELKTGAGTKGGQSRLGYAGIWGCLIAQGSKMKIHRLRLRGLQGPQPHELGGVHNFFFFVQLQL